MNIHRSFAYKIALFKEQLLLLFTDVIISSCIYIYKKIPLPINTSKQNTIYKMTNGKKPSPNIQSSHAQNNTWKYI